MELDDFYDTIDGVCEGIFRAKGSRFLAYAYPLNSEVQIKDILLRLKSEHPKARHFCWAYRLSPDKSMFRVNDDGEPSGSAGRPILNTILSENLTNVLVVVVRYFGGTLLGVPGLINAYKSATIDALNNGKVVNKTVNNHYLVSFSYEATSQVMKIVKDEQLNVLSQIFDIRCELGLEIRQSKATEILLKLEHIEGVIMQIMTGKYD
ncbi:MAG: hypothetical protein JWQ28_590 [Pedobacter sp.]|nr:hypothetical protein [Pedobacter sp.]